MTRSPPPTGSADRGILSYVLVVVLGGSLVVGAFAMSGGGMGTSVAPSVDDDSRGIGEEISKSVSESNKGVVSGDLVTNTGEQSCIPRPKADESGDTDLPICGGAKDPIQGENSLSSIGEDTSRPNSANGNGPPEDNPGLGEEDEEDEDEDGRESGPGRGEGEFSDDDRERENGPESAPGEDEDEDAEDAVGQGEGDNGETGKEESREDETPQTIENNNESSEEQLQIRAPAAFEAGGSDIHASVPIRDTPDQRRVAGGELYQQSGAEGGNITENTTTIPWADEGTLQQDWEKLSPETQSSLRSLVLSVQDQESAQGELTRLDLVPSSQSGGVTIGSYVGQQNAYAPYDVYTMEHRTLGTDYTLVEGVTEYQSGASKMSISGAGLARSPGSAFTISDPNNGWEMEVYADEGTGTIHVNSAELGGDVDTGIAATGDHVIIINLADGTISGVDQQLPTNSAQTIEIEHGDKAYGSYSILSDGRTSETVQTPTYRHIDGLLLDATFDVTYETSASTTVKRMSVSPDIEPATVESSFNAGSETGVDDAVAVKPRVDVTSRFNASSTTDVTSSAVAFNDDAVGGEYRWTVIGPSGTRVVDNQIAGSQLTWTPTDDGAYEIIAETASTAGPGRVLSDTKQFTTAPNATVSGASRVVSRFNQTYQYDLRVDGTISNQAGVEWYVIPADEDASPGSTGQIDRLDEESVLQYGGSGTQTSIDFTHYEDTVRVAAVYNSPVNNSEIVATRVVEVYDPIVVADGPQTAVAGQTESYNALILGNNTGTLSDWEWELKMPAGPEYKAGQSRNTSVLFRSNTSTGNATLTLTAEHAETNQRVSTGFTVDVYYNSFEYICAGPGESPSPDYCTEGPDPPPGGDPPPSADCGDDEIFSNGQCIPIEDPGGGGPGDGGGPGEPGDPPGPGERRCGPDEVFQDGSCREIDDDEDQSDDDPLEDQCGPGESLVGQTCVDDGSDPPQNEECGPNEYYKLSEGCVSEDPPGGNTGGGSNNSPDTPDPGGPTTGDQTSPGTESTNTEPESADAVDETEDCPGGRQRFDGVCVEVVDDSTEPPEWDNSLDDTSEIEPQPIEIENCQTETQNECIGTAENGYWEDGDYYQDPGANAPVLQNGESNNDSNNDDGGIWPF